MLRPHPQSKTTLLLVGVEDPPTPSSRLPAHADDLFEDGHVDCVHVNREGVGIAQIVKSILQSEKGLLLLLGQCVEAVDYLAELDYLREICD